MTDGTVAQPEDADLLFIGIDDTDTLDSPGTNQLARRFVTELPGEFEMVLVMRHQLFFDPRVPYTSQNGSASLIVRHGGQPDLAALVALLRATMRAWFVPGSDPGLCVARRVPETVREFARRAQGEVVTQREARDLAACAGIHLEGLGGTEDGVIGALAAVGLAAAGNDGRVVHRPGWTWPDSFAGHQPVAAILARGVDDVIDASTDRPVKLGRIDVGRHLRPAYRNRRVVLYVERAGQSGSEPTWRAMKLT